MSQGWENLEPAPIEFLHGKLMDLFHEWRKSKTENTTVEITGNDFNNIVAKAKTLTYEKYKNLDLQKAIPKEKLADDIQPIYCKINGCKEKSTSKNGLCFTHFDKHMTNYFNENCL